ncbi:MAG: hypothetical protein COA42_08850 [Alteromonadaceae bacterium]|nr:MAG: hypothetical protein COA42_08850 [Alteromonadaceae bacterium]
MSFLTSLQHKYGALESWVQRHPMQTCVAILLLLGFCTRFFLLQHPDTAVFDEVHFNFFSSSYHSGLYYYDIHPPLGKLLIALSTAPFGGLETADVVRTISTPYPDNNYIAMRFLPALAGALLPLVIFLISRELGINFFGSFVAGALIALDNGLLVQSRFILMDAFLLLFGFVGIWLFLSARRLESWPRLLLSAVAVGCSFSVKWLGVSFLGLIGLIMISDFVIKLWKTGAFFKAISPGVAYLSLALCTYVVIFFIHFQLLPLSNHQGDQFMGTAFRSTLQGSEFENATSTIRSVRCPVKYKDQLKYGMPNTTVTPKLARACAIDYTEFTAPGFIGKFLELNRVMYTTNQGLGKSHPDASPWYSWPLMTKPLYYWYKDGARIYFLGNPLVWWLSIAAVVGLTGLLALSILTVLGLHIGRAFNPQWLQSSVPWIQSTGQAVSQRVLRSPALWILSIGFWSNMLPFTFVERIMFMYHYLNSLIFAILLTGYLVGLIKQPKWWSISLTMLALACFLFISPLSLGLNWFGSDMLWFLKALGWHP